MPDKPKPSKKKSAKPAAPPAAKANRKSQFYVCAPDCAAVISSQKPKNGAHVKTYADFPAARLAAIDALVAAIETAERQLLAIKRASRFEQLPKG